MNTICVRFQMILIIEGLSVGNKRDTSAKAFVGMMTRIGEVAGSSMVTFLTAMRCVSVATIVTSLSFASLISSKAPANTGRSSSLAAA